jgi:hypothetical protein
MRSTMRRRGRTDGFRFFLLTAGAIVAFSPASRAAELSVEAPSACVDPTTLADEVGDLIGQPLADVADVDFRIRIAESPPGRWRLHLETVARAAPGDGAATVRGSRDIEGASCTELEGAASVAIAVSIRSIADAAVVPEPPRPAPSKPPAAPAQAPSAPQASIATTTQAPAPWHPTIALALVTDTGALPNTALGVEIEGDLQRRWLRLGLLGSWFGAQDTVGADSTGGSFQLAFGAALGCFAPRWGRLTPLACGGFELGRLAGTGLGVARPETGSALWSAARTDLGVTTAISANTAFLVRAEAAFPLRRPEFVFDETKPVYSPSRLALRLTAGFEVGF